jgi:hypothetical protein
MVILGCGCGLGEVGRDLWEVCGWQSSVEIEGRDLYGFGGFRNLFYHFRLVKSKKYFR